MFVVCAGVYLQCELPNYLIAYTKFPFVRVSEHNYPALPIFALLYIQRYCIIVISGKLKKSL
jgi:hypothetical protein